MTKVPDGFPERARDSLKDHVLKAEQPEPPARLWVCRRPDSSQYWFRVVATGGALIVYGDIADRILMMHDVDSVAWLRKAIDDPSYVIQKIQGERRSKEVFDEQLVEPYLLAESAARASDPEDAKRYADALDDWRDDYGPDEGTEDMACQVVSKHLGEMEEMAEFYHWERDVLWTYYALERFVQLLDASESTHA